MLITLAKCNNYNNLTRLRMLITLLKMLITWPKMLITFFYKFADYGKNGKLSTLFTSYQHSYQHKQFILRKVGQ